MRRCKGRYHKNKEWHDFELGYFHQFNTNYEEFESGAGNFAIAIVELPDGTIIQPLADEIMFIDIIN